MMRLTREEAKDYIKNNYTESYLRDRGTPTDRNIKCIAGTHEDRTPSMGYDARAKQLHCFTCDARMDIFDLIGLDYNESDFNGQLQKACDLYGIELVRESTGDYKSTPKPAVTEEPEERTDKYAGYYRQCNQNLQQKFPNGWRGISLETLNRFMCGYDAGYQRYDGAKPVEAVIMPNSNGYFTPRAINPAPDEPKNPYRKGDKRGLFNADALEDKERPCIVTEGEIDCMSVCEVGGNAVGLGGTSGTGFLLRALEKRESTTQLVLAMDNDSAGEKCKSKIISGIEAGIKEGRFKAENVQYIVCNPYGDVKDANDNLQQNRYFFEQDIAGIMQNPRSWNYVNKYCSASFIGEFSKGVRDKVATPPISTGFRKLDEALDGGLYPGLVAIGAVSSLGKTTLCQQIGDNISASGHDVIYISLEMSRYELMAKTISRYTYINVLNGACGYNTRSAKTTRGILDGSRYSGYSPEEKELISLSVEDYRDIMRYSYIVEGMGNVGTAEVRRFVEQHIEATGNRPVVIVDYLQILAPADARASDKQNTDKNVLELKRLSRDFNLPVIVISSFNRGNYATEEGVTELAFKESGAIEYGVDTLIGLQFSGEKIKSMKDVRQAKAKNPREVEAVIIKNRNAPIPEDPIQFDYNPLFNYFSEV